MIRPAPAIAAVIIAARPTGPAPTTATVSPGPTPPFCTPISKPVGRMSARNSTCSSRDALGHEVDRRLGVGDARVLGLHAVDQVAEDPADPADRLAVGGHPALARPAAAARGDRGDEHAVALLQAADRGAGLDHRPDRLVAEDAALGHRRHVPLEDVQVGAADRRRVDLDDDVRRLADARVVGRLPRPLAGPAEDECLHARDPTTGRVTGPLQRRSSCPAARRAPPGAIRARPSAAARRGRSRRGRRRARPGRCRPRGSCGGP